jgi:hypothetical protein
MNLNNSKNWAINICPFTKLTQVEFQENVHAFRKGFQLGAKMMLEILEDERPDKPDFFNINDRLLLQSFKSLLKRNGKKLLRRRI